MRIVLIAGGSRGDVQPYVALGQGLRAAGHAVSVLATADFRELVTRHGLELFETGGSAQAAAQSQMQGLVEEGNLLKILAATGRGAEQLAYQTAVAGLAAAQGADLILGGLGAAFIGLALARKLGVVFMQAYLLPLSPTREFPSALAPLPQTPLTRWANGLSHRAAQTMLWQMFRGADRAARTQVLGLPPAAFWGPLGALQRANAPVLYGYSPSVVPPPKDWSANLHVTGYWFLDAPTGWQPPADLVDFLRAGPPPVYVGFGSMVNTRPEATAALVLEALARAGQRGLLSAGWGGLKPESLPANVFMVGSVPHSWLFPQMAVVVHHGGAGTTAAGLRAGVPSILTPFFGDQPFWGQRVQALGVGPAPIPRPRLSVDRLAEAMRQAVTDAGMRQRAASLGAAIRAEDGVARAVEVIEQLPR